MGRAFRIRGGIAGVLCKPLMTLSESLPYTQLRECHACGTYAAQTHMFIVVVLKEQKASMPGTWSQRLPTCGEPRQVTVIIANRAYQREPAPHQLA